MVATVQSSGLEVRAVGDESFDQIYPLLLEFNNPRMTEARWRSMLFGRRWSDEAERGYALFDDGRAVGFIGTIFSKRDILGRVERFCNASSWIVRPAYRHASVQLLKPLLALRDCTLLNLTPTPRSVEIFARLGFRPLEAERLLLFPWGLPWHALRGSFTRVDASAQSELSADDARIFGDLGALPGVHHLLLRRGARTCYVVAAIMHKRRARFASVLYISDRRFFWENRMLVHAACVRLLGCVGVAVDARFAEGRTVVAAIRTPAQRLYRPAKPDITPLAVDGLYSELMTVAF